jgi:outer membrane murein-binding lipoprotein Lpp
MIRTINHGKRGSFAPYLATLVLGSTLLAGCSSPPKAPDQALQAAELAIATAEQARVADYASPELGQARDKLTAAREAVVKEEMTSAARLAAQSRADAELATAKAEVAKAQAVNDELGKNINTLQQELQRNSGGAK